MLSVAVLSKGGKKMLSDLDSFKDFEKFYPRDKGYKFISIARFNKFWKGKEFISLAPPSEIIKIETNNFTRNFIMKKF